MAKFAVERKSKLARRLMAYVVLFSIGATLITTSIQLYFDYKSDVRFVHEQMEQIKISYVESISNSMWSFDDKQLNILLNGILKVRDIEYVYVTKEDKTLFRVGIDMDENVIKKEYELTFLHNGKYNYLGELHVVAGMKDIYDRLKDKVLVIFITNGAITFSVAIFLFIVFQNVVTRHLERIAEFTRRLSPERLKRSLILPGRRKSRMGTDEIDQVVTAINEMRGNLSRSYQALKEGEEHVRLLLDSTAEGIYGIDIKGACTFHNRACAEILGYDRAENMLGKNMHEVMHHTRADGTPYPVEKCRIYQSYKRNQHIHVDDEVFWRKDGSRFPAEYWSRPIRQGSQTVGAVVTFLDISERRRAEERILRFNEELEGRVEDRTRELRAVQKELLGKERLAVLGQLTATVSHELRNPLGTIRTSASILRLQLKNSAPKLERAFDRMERNIERCNRIIDELLDFTRTREMSPEPTLLDDWLSKLLDELKVPKGITVRREFGLPDYSISVDPERLRRAVINVYDNACQAIQGGGAEGLVTITTSRSVEHVEIAVTDNGPGISEDVRSKIFEPLFSTKNFGVGLGMSVVRNVLKQHGGDVEIESSEDRGTRIVLVLPLGDGARLSA